MHSGEREACTRGGRIEKDEADIPVQQHHQERIDEMSDNIKGQVVSKILSSPLFALQLDESTDVANIAQLLVFCRYITSQGIEQDFLFCRPLKTTTKAPILWKY